MTLKGTRITAFLTIVLGMLFAAMPAFAQLGTRVSTTTITVSICGDSAVNEGETCDVPGETGQYSTSIAGRQCSTECQWGPYCGDAILQTLHGEECDDGNNTDDDFCSATCLEEKTSPGGGTTGGGGGGGGNSSRGGSDTELGDTRVSVQGYAYPNSTVNILIDGRAVGTVRANSSGEFLFTGNTNPGATSVSVWANDSRSTRSITLNTTFDVTQGAVTNVNGVMLPPTIRASKTQLNPGEVITLSGQTIPDVPVEVYIDAGSPILRITSALNGEWTTPFNTAGVSAGTHTAKARFIRGSGALRTESAFGTALQLALGVNGQATSNADLNRDGSINLIDFSILIFWWNTNGGNSNPPADINGNGRVSLEDFSILLFNWTG